MIYVSATVQIFVLFNPLSQWYLLAAFTNDVQILRTGLQPAYQMSTDTPHLMPKP
jgi:hypothetical protein